MNRGFTVVEVLVTLVIIAIILTLGTLGLRGTLANGRDAERRADIETLARGLETRYDKGNSYSFYADGLTRAEDIPPGSYPGNNEAWNFFYYNGFPLGSFFPGASESALVTPSGHRINSICFFYSSFQPKCDAAEKDANIQELFSDGNGGWKDIYIYEFIGANKAYCNGDACVRYNLYWLSEVDKTVYKGIPGLKVWKSKHQ